MLGTIATWLFGPRAAAADAASVNARFDAVANFMIGTFVAVVILAGLIIALVVYAERIEKRLKRQEEYLRRATAAMHRSGVVTDDIEVESVEAK